jgi:hypothetical protein
VQNALTVLYRRWGRTGELDRRRPWSRVLLRATEPDGPAPGGQGLVDEQPLVRQAIDRLPEQQRIVVVLRFLCDPVQLLIGSSGRGDDVGTVEASQLVYDALSAIGAIAQITELADDLLEHRAWIIDEASACALGAPTARAGQDRLALMPSGSAGVHRRR